MRHIQRHMSEPLTTIELLDDTYRYVASLVGVSRPRLSVLVTLADIDVPILTFVGLTDAIGHPDSVRAIDRSAPRADVYEVGLRAGHFGLRRRLDRNNQTWPAVAAWVQWRADGTPLPHEIAPAADVERKPMLSAGAGAAVVIQAAELDKSTPMSLGLLLDEQARKSLPPGVMFPIRASPDHWAAAVRQV